MKQSQKAMNNELKAMSKILSTPCSLIIASNFSPPDYLSEFTHV